MCRFMRGAALALLALCAAVPVRAEEPAEKPKVKIEFRRAEFKPGEGLVEVAVPGTKEKLYMHKTADAATADIEEARVGEDSRQKPAIDLVFTKEGAKKMERLSEQHRDKPIVILIDGKPVSAPLVREKFSSRAQITGNITKDEVEKIVKDLTGK